MKRKINIRNGLLITLFLLIILTMVALWLIQTVFMDDFYQSIKRGDVTKLSNDIASLIDDDWQSQLDDEEFQSKMHDLSLDREASFCFTLNGTPYGVSYVKDDLLFNLIRENKLDEYILDADTNMSTTLHPVANDKGHGAHALVLVKGLKSDGDDKLSLIIATTLIPTQSLTRTVTIQLITVTAILLVIAVVLAFVISKKLAKPIKKLSEVSKHLADDTIIDFPKQTGIVELDDLVDSMKSASVELSRVDQLQKDLVANISHDIKTPLTLIKGYAEMIKDFPDEDNTENLDVIINETNRLSHLVNDVLDLSKLQSGTTQFNDQPYDIVESTSNLVSHYSSLFKEYDFNSSLPSTSIMIDADEKLIIQATSNLINNALKYTGSDKKIYIKLQAKDDTVTFMIKDTGSGIPEDKIKDVWQRYYKIDGSIKHDRFEVGSGIGLSIVKGILDHYTEDFGVKNVPDGCIFYYTLPILHTLNEEEKQ